MTNTEEGVVQRIIESEREAGEAALDAVRKFLDTVNGAFPDVTEDGPRSRIINSAFEMTKELVGTGAQMAERIVKATGDAFAPPKDGSGSGG